MSKLHRLRVLRDGIKKLDEVVLENLKEGVVYFLHGMELKVSYHDGNPELTVRYRKELE